MAIKFRLPDGSEQDIVCISANGFPVATGEDFLALLQAVGASGPDVPKPTLVEKFLSTHPAASAFVTTPRPVAVSYGTQPFFGVNAFKFTNAQGTSKFGRYRIVPESGPAYVSDEEAATRPPNALADNLRSSLEKGPVKFRLLVQVAAADDSITDATKVWPDSRPTVELGPSFELHVLRSDDARIKLDFRMPLRAAFTVESSPRMIGWTFTPRLNLDIADPLGFAGWKLGLLAGPLFADRRYDDYFYTVAPQYATTLRPAYQAVGGYAGTQTTVALSKRFPHFWVGAYVRYDTLSGAAFIDSPLVQSRSYWAGGVGISWMIHRSSTMVEVPD